MQNEFLVYDRQGETCNTCKSKILKSTQGEEVLLVYKLSSNKSFNYILIKHSLTYIN